MDSAFKADFSGLDRPIGDATGLPGSCYGVAALRAERDLLFGRHWVAVAVGASIPDPGSQLAVELAGWPLLLVRGQDRRSVHSSTSADTGRCAWWMAVHPPR